MSISIGSNREKLLREACALVEQRIVDGKEKAALEVVSQFPDIANDEEAVIELLYAEYSALDSQGRRPESEAWLAQFSEERLSVFRPRLERLLQLHDLLHENPTSSTASTSRIASPRLDHPTCHSQGSISSLSEDSPSRLQRSTIDDVNNQPFEHYELLKEIGRGGMGIVYLARQRPLERLVAVKVLRSTAIRESERARFQREAELAANLQHANIVQVIEVSLQAGKEYLSMEYISGGSLDERMSSQPWSNHDIATLLKTLAEAVHYAHERGVVHRDIKPANILFTSQSTPKLVDFGLAKSTQSANASPVQNDGLIGTPSYMSPEQVLGSESEIGPATDIYSLGVVLYELLAGRLPFDGKTAVETLRWIVDRECEVPSRIRSSVPRDLETICLKCLAKSPMNRYASASALADDLSRFLDHRPILARRIGWVERAHRSIRRHPRTVLFVSTIFMVMMAAGGLLYFQRIQMAEMTKEVLDRKRIGDWQQRRASDAELAHEETLMKARELVKQWSLIGVRLENEPGMDGLRRKAFEDAVAYYEDYLSMNRGNETIRSEAAQAAVRAAQIHMDLGLLDQAEVELLQADQWLADQEVTHAVLWQRSDGMIQLAHALRRRGRLREAEETYGKAIAMINQLLQATPDNTRYLIREANALINLCVVFQTENRSLEAIDTYLVALRMYLRASFVRVKATPSLIMTNEIASSASDLRVFEVVLRQHIEEIGNLLRQCKEPDEEKLRVLSKENFLPEIALCLDDLSTLLKRMQKVELAESSVRESIALHRVTREKSPENRRRDHYLARSYVNLGAILTESGQLEEALKYLVEADQVYSKLVEDFPDRVHYRADWSHGLTQLAQCRIDTQDYQASVETALRAVKIQEHLATIQPNSPWLDHARVHALQVLGLGYRFLNRTEESRQSFEKSLNVIPGQTDPMNSWAWTIVTLQDASPSEIAQAIELVEKAIQVVPDGPDKWNTLAVGLARLERWEEAETAVKKAIELSKGGVWFDWIVQSMVDSAMGRPESAREWLLKAQEFQKSHEPRNTQQIRLSAMAQKMLEESSR